MIEQVHEVDTGCSGPVEPTGMHVSRSDRDTLSAKCNGCGAVFGGLTIDKPSSLEVALGVLLAGSTHDSYSASQSLANLDWVPSTTFYTNMPLIVEAVDDLFNEVMARQRERVRRERRRGLVEIDPTKHYFVHNWEALKEMTKGNMGVKVRRDRSVPVVTCYTQEFYISEGQRTKRNHGAKKGNIPHQRYTPASYVSFTLCLVGGRDMF